MHFITDTLIAGLMAYLSFTNFMAVEIAALLGEDTQTAENEMVEVEKEMSSLTPLPSAFALIPDILLRSASYQQAAVVTSNLGSTPQNRVTNPKEAIVNIYCTFTSDKAIRTTTGTGFFVDERGVILTNAHVAQFLLLEATDALGDTVCTVRDGSPASARFTAELLYIPPAWVAEHAQAIDAIAPSGTGERDYALLYVTSTVSGEALPAAFPTLAIDTDLLSTGRIDTEVQVAGYPAGDRSKSTATDLIAVSATTSISELFTYGSNYADVIALRGSVIGEQGASGGPVVDAAGQVIGMITTRGNDEKDGEGSLRAITVSHINRTIEEETGISLGRHLSGDVAEKALVFNETMTPFLTTLLTNNISN